MQSMDSLLPSANRDAALAADSRWRPLPRAALTAFLLANIWWAWWIGLAAAFVGSVAAHRLGLRWAFSSTAIAMLVAMAGGIWLASRRYRYTHWRLDDQGFSVRRGRMWQSEIRVPGNRVQHLDVRRGPLERWLKLATLVIHTAGTRESSVGISGLDRADAQHLRDVLSRRTESEEDAFD